MQRILAAFTLCASFCAVVSTSVQSASLQVDPVLLEVAAPGAATMITLRNEGNVPINAQVRMFKWSQIRGVERLEPTDDVIASPPALTLAANGTHVIRIVRVSKRPVAAEESYRLLVDQIPNMSQRRNGMVNMVLRHSIPVFFNIPDHSGPAVVWSVAIQGSDLYVAARNDGDRRLRVSSLQLRDTAGSNLIVAKGLVGYALAGATMQWRVAGGGRLINRHGPIRIKAQGDIGAIDDTALAQDLR